MLLHHQAAVWERIQKACFEEDKITFVDYCGLNKISPQVWLFEHLVPSWQHCLGKFRRHRLAGDSKSLEGVLSVYSLIPPPVCSLYFTLAHMCVSSQLPAPATMPARCCHSSSPRWTHPLEGEQINQIHSSFFKFSWSWYLITQTEK